MRDHRVWGGVLFAACYIAVAFFLPGVLTAAERNEGARYCDVLNIEAAATMLEARPEELVKTDRQLMVSPEDQQENTYIINPMGCGYRVKQDFLKIISFKVYPFRNPQRARREFQTLRDNFAVAGKVVDIAAIGDYAFRVPDRRFHRFVALKGNVLVDVLMPQLFEQQKEIAALVFTR